MIIVKSKILNLFRHRFKFSVARSHFLLKTMSSKCKIAVVQFTATNDKINNLNTVTKLIRNAVENNAKVHM